MAVLPDNSGSARLSPAHRAHLRQSGLSDATVAAAGLFSVTPDEAAALGFARGVEGLCFPYPGCAVTVAGRQVPYTRIRVDRPREPGRRYENPLKARIDQGLPFHPYVAVAVAALSKDPRAPVVVTEGEKKALTLTQEGWPAIGLPGVFLFTDPASDRPHARRPLHPDLRRWAWRGREVRVCFDSDRLNKDGVGLACERLCAALTRAGALVRVVRLPALPELDKTGADDLLARRGPGALRAAMEAAEPWRPGAWLIDRVPDGLPVATLPVALSDLQARLKDATAEERRALVDRLGERFPALDEAAAHRLVGASTDAPLPEVVISGRQARDLIAESWQVLLRSRFGDRVFRYGTALVQVVEDEGGPRMETLDATRLTGLLLRAADWVREEDGETRPARVPQDVPRDMVALPSTKVGRLTGLTALPVLRRDGGVVGGPGFDPDSGLFTFARLTLDLPEPTPRARAAALDLLHDELLGDFPFARDSDRAHALALLLLPLVRHLVDGPTPLHLVEAPSEGTGKTLLADVAHVLATGRSVDPTTLPSREEEVRKKLTAILLAGPPVVLLDNIDRTLDSASLAAVLTRDRWSDRLLGQSAVVSLPNRAVWVATANNPAMTRELRRRCCRVRLDAGVERPWLRAGFRHPDLTGWVVANRAALLSAALTLVRGWLADGAPHGAVTLGSFTAWAQVVGGILDHAGVPGFLEDRDAPMEPDDPDEDLWQAFVARWARAHGRRPVDGRTLVVLAVETGLWPAEAAGSAPEAARFGMALSRRRDRIFGRHRLTVRRDARRKQNRYALVPVDAAKAAR